MSDLISRHGLLIALHESGLCNDNWLEVRNEINALPSAEPKTGEWEMCKDDDGIYGVCSICGRDADFSHYGMPYKFCPNCGAKMRGEEG